MTVDYNLIIIGGSITARYAAELARRLRARVALVERRAAPLGLPELPLLSSETEAIALQAIQASPATDWQASCRWSHAVIQHQLQQHAQETLTMQGVDLVVGTAEFCQRNGEFGVWVKGDRPRDDRWLRGHRYLLCPGSVPTLPPIAGLIDVPFLTLDDVLALKPGRSAPALDGHSLIVGRSPRSVELAQILARYGKTVTLLVESPNFATDWDQDIARRLLAQLEADGVTVLTGAAALQTKWIDQRVWIQTPHQAIAADHLIFATSRQPLLGHLNLGAAGVQIHHGYTPVNDRLRIDHRKIYGCGDAIASDLAPNQHRYHAELAVRNSLFLSLRSRHRRPILSQVNTQLPIVQIGLTEAQARKQWGDRLRVLRAEMGRTNRAAIDGPVSGFCKLLLRSNGKILGAHAIGSEAGEWMGAIALAMHQGLTFRQLTAIHAPTATFAEILNDMALNWETQTLRGDRPRRALMELFMNWQRDWSRSR